jgi:uncharacterized DUF497 family protein
MTEAWDPFKAAANERKHGVRFAEAAAVLFDPLALKLDEADHGGEARLAVVGTDSCERVLVVVYTHRGDTRRIISARRATRQERKQYEEGI